MTVLPLAYAVMHGLWRSATEKSGCAKILNSSKKKSKKASKEILNSDESPLMPPFIVLS